MRHATKLAVIVHLDAPADGVVTGPVSVVRGWLAVDAPGTVEDVYLRNAEGTSLPLALVDRPDVRAAQPARSSMGFSGWIDARLAVRGPWRVGFRIGGETGEVAVRIGGDRHAALEFAAAKARKLARIRPLLRCPECGANLEDEPQLRCTNGHAFAATADAFDLRDAASRASEIGLVQDVSAHGYDASLIELIEGSPGPILDAGAGLRPDYRDDIVNLEIVPYPTTDVIAAADRLPFADATFDLVISVAVLEHVRDPFGAAKELERVLLPGGRVFAAVPFLQPYHAYPNHYYNMTKSGLINLFAGCDVERLEVPASGRPVFLLTWMLRAWRDGLPPAVAREFEQLRIGELIVDPMTLVDLPFVRELSEAANVQFAALNVLIGRKRGR